MKSGVSRNDYRGTHRYDCGIHGVRGLVGVTTAMRMMAAGGLEWWKRDQLLRLVFERRAELEGMLAGDGLEATLKYFQKAGEGAGREKRDTGSEVHAAIESIVKGREPIVSARIEQHVEHFRKWLTDARPVIKQAEYMVVSETHGYGGTGDLAFVLDGEYWAADIKTGKLLPETGMQLAALRWADHAGREGDPVEYPVPPTTRHGVLLLHENGIELEPFDIRPDREFDAFLACLRLYRYERIKKEVLAA